MDRGTGEEGSPEEREGHRGDRRGGEGHRVDKDAAR